MRENRWRTVLFPFTIDFQRRLNVRFQTVFLGEEERQELPLLLEQAKTAEELVKKNGEALAALPLEFENYEKRVETLAILHQYIEGTYTLFPERQKEISVENENQQLSLFDFMQEEPFDMEKLEEQNLSQPANEVADMIDVIGTDGEIITAVPQKTKSNKRRYHSTAERICKRRE